MTMIKNLILTGEGKLKKGEHKAAFHKETTVFSYLYTYHVPNQSIFIIEAFSFQSCDFFKWSFKQVLLQLANQLRSLEFFPQQVAQLEGWFLVVLWTH